MVCHRCKDLVDLIRSIDYRITLVRIEKLKLIHYRNKHFFDNTFPSIFMFTPFWRWFGYDKELEMLHNQIDKLALKEDRLDKRRRVLENGRQ